MRAAIVILVLCAVSVAQERATATFGTTVVIPSGLRGLVYYLNEGESFLPDFDKRKPAGAIYTTKLSIPPQDFSMGFPGISNRYEWFAIDYRGRFWIETPGDYQFALTSDDGSILYIDDHSLINLDGTHAPETQTGRVKLDCGIHNIRISYFQGPRYQVALVLSISGGGKKWRVFNTEEFKPPSDPEAWVCGGKRVAYDPNRRSMVEVVKRESVSPLEAELTAVLSAKARPIGFLVRAAAYPFWQSPAGTQTSRGGTSGRRDPAAPGASWLPCRGRGSRVGEASPPSRRRFP